MAPGGTSDTLTADVDSHADDGRIGRDAQVRPADWVAAAYNTVLALVWATLLARAWYAPAIFAAHAAAAAMPWLIARSGGRLSRPVGWLREVYPLLWLIAWWTELDFLRFLLHQTAYDGLVAGLDRAVFGVNLDAIWMPSMPAVWFSELMHLLYWGYYPAVLLPLLYVAIFGPPDRLRDVTLRVTLIYVACFLVYIAFPVDGPHFLRPRYEGPLTDGFFYRLVWAFQSAGDSQGASFPSSHVAASVTMAYLGIRWFSRGAAALLVLAAAGVTISIVYTQNHYAVDSLAGVIWAFAVQLVVAPALLRWWGRMPADERASVSRPSLQPD